MRGAPNNLIQGDTREGQKKVELHEVAQGWFEMVIVAELHGVPSLNCRIKNHS